MRIVRSVLVVLAVGLVAAASMGEGFAAAGPAQRRGASCAKSADCGTGLYCAFRQAGCQVARGVCEDASCANDPMNVPYCSCDGRSTGTGSMCVPDRPYAKLGACSP